MDTIRCPWAKGELYHRYHDEQWGVPEHDDRMLFEMIILEGAQAGLSWETILKKRGNYREAFDKFDAERIAAYDDTKLAALLQDAGIIRNRLKIAAAVANAKAFIQTRNEFGTFDKYIWSFVDGRPVQNSFTTMTEVPAKTPQSDLMSKDLSRRGFKFVGSTICYAFMQATGMVNDHLTSCFRWRELTIDPSYVGVPRHTGRPSLDK
ncbi:MAG TPA: DNA-3-methyladenine glycosylase I [Bryobacteraceae bacterium]|nr:DNA-3-methyladenine glycosylase I [Bryobacteraceae bacterium]